MTAAVKSVAITLKVNGEDVAETVPVRLNLVDFLRADLGLTGTHVGCEHGVCGACTVIVDGAIVRGCLMLAAQADIVTSIENSTLHSAASSVSPSSPPAALASAAGGAGAASPTCTVGAAALRRAGAGEGSA